MYVAGEKIKVQANNFSKLILLDNQSLRVDKRYVEYNFASESYDLVLTAAVNDVYVSNTRWT